MTLRAQTVSLPVVHTNPSLITVGQYQAVLVASARQGSSRSAADTESSSRFTFSGAALLVLQPEARWCGCIHWSCSAAMFCGLVLAHDGQMDLGV
eukprot:2836862-Rhodomonas_salina.8